MNRHRREVIDELLSIPHSRNFGSPLLGLEQKHGVQQGFGCWRAAGHIDIDGYDTIHAPHHRVAIVVVATSVGATAHADHPLRVRHLVINLTKGGCHFVCHCSRHNHHVGLSRGCSEDDSETVLVVSGHGDVHHLDTAAGETKRQRPKRTLACPVNNLIDRGPGLRHVSHDGKVGLDNFWSLTVHIRQDLMVR